MPVTPPELKKEGVILVPTTEVCILGVPLGSAPFSASYVQERLFPRVKTAMERLQDLNDSQSALFLLRVSYGIVRATHFMRITTHFMRTTPLALRCSALRCHAPLLSCSLPPPRVFWPTREIFYFPLCGLLPFACRPRFCDT